MSNYPDGSRTAVAELYNPQYSENDISRWEDEARKAFFDRVEAIEEGLTNFYSEYIGDYEDLIPAPTLAGLMTTLSEEFFRRIGTSKGKYEEEKTNLLKKDAVNPTNPVEIVKNTLDEMAYRIYELQRDVLKSLSGLTPEEQMKTADEILEEMGRFPVGSNLEDFEKDIIGIHNHAMDVIAEERGGYRWD